jgi:UTP--glucose-1-phosphate uridylyltransferase
VSTPPFDHLVAPFVAAMEAAGMGVETVASFRLHLERYLGGETGTLGRDQIEPVTSLPDIDSLGGHTEIGNPRLSRAVVIKLNGGLGTGMGLEGAKSLIEVRPGSTFLDLIARQVLDFRRRTGHRVPLVFMNSFRTETDTARALSGYSDLAVEGLPAGFLQHKVPKVLVAGGRPASWPADPELEWCPPGHGDLYPALVTSGVLTRLLDAGYEVAFISNSDNLGAVLDPKLLGFMIENKAPFMIEVADRTPADRKGGHLCRLRDGRLALRESAQCPPGERDDFRDIHRYPFFNTNNIWVSLPALKDLFDRHGGVLPLATIVNRKSLDPRDASSPVVVQLESAMGAAVSLFDHSVAVRVPRRRFSPVKNTNDLLGVRSDAFELTDDHRIVLAAGRSAPPTIDLDPRFYRHLDAFEARFPLGPPSLVGCTSLTVEGDVTFGGGVVVEGEVEVRGGPRASRIPDGAVLRSEHRA